MFHWRPGQEALGGKFEFRDRPEPAVGNLQEFLAVDAARPPALTSNFADNRPT
jgi:hypothetical protein